MTETAYRVGVNRDTDPDGWLRQRREIVTATDIATLVHSGPSRWEQLRKQKTEGAQGIRRSPYMRWGQEREPVIAAWAETQYPVQHNEALLISTVDPRFGATPDLLPVREHDGTDYVDHDVVGDIKTAKAPEWSAPPPQYVDQVLWQMMVTGHRQGIIIAEFHDDFRVLSMEPTVYEVEWDGDRVELLKRVAEKFLSGGEPDELDALISKRVAAERQMKSAKAELDAIDDLIRDHIGDQDWKHVCEYGSLSYTLPKPSEKTDYTALKKAHPELCQQYTKTVAPRKRTLRVTPAKGAA